MFKRISKREARKLYEQGQDFIICASNLRPDTFGVHWDGIMTPLDFDGYLSVFRYYNCTDTETGLTVAFYKKISA